jgi:poly(hydroxyalkanoate) granule-associated protein
MTDESRVIEEDTEQAEAANPLLASLRRILLAGIGALALTQDQIEDFVGKLVERGQIAEGDARNLISEVVEVVERRKKSVQDTTRKAEEGFDKQIENLLARMNIPTKSEIGALSDKIAELSRKVDELNLK